MSIKNILVALAPRPEPDPGRDFAISMAKALNGHVSGRAYGLDVDIGVDAFGGLPSDLLQSYRATLKKEAQAAVTRFEETAAKAKIDASAQIVLAPLAVASGMFARTGRAFDVSVLTQSADGIAHMGDVFTESALFHSGRPVIVVPRTGRAQFKTNHILIAWDGSVHAARAVGAAKPFLEQAKTIDVLTVGEKAKEPETHVADLVRNLEREGLNVTLKRRSGDDAGKVILREAEKDSASMVVLGAYGHSRLREFIFGGVTRLMVNKATMPVLLMH